MNRNNRQMVKLGEPWLSPLNEQLVSDVNGFISFLHSRYEEFSQNIEVVGMSEIGKKINELEQWRCIAQQVLSCPRNGYIDSFALCAEPVEMATTFYKLQEVKVLYLAQQQLSPMNMMMEDEEKFTEPLPLFGVISNNIGVATPGYILGDCLRQVSTKAERREIMKALRCEIDPVTKNVLEVYEGEQCVVKRIAKSTNHIMNERLRREFKIQMFLSNLKHKNINQLVQYFETESTIVAISKCAGDQDLLAMLLAYIETNKQGYPEARVKSLFRGVAEGLLVAHNLGIAHRDISLENLVLNKSDGEGVVEIIDWGHGISTSLEDRVCVYEGPVGKSRYMAPELFAKQKRMYDPFKADVFAFGVCLFSALTSQMPFGNIADHRAKLLRESPAKLIEAINDKLNVKVDLSCEALDLLERCLAWYPDERCTMSEVLNHSFFN